MVGLEENDILVDADQNIIGCLLLFCKVKGCDRNNVEACLGHERVCSDALFLFVNGTIK